MALNKEMFTTYFKFKDFDKCIGMLRKEITSILVKRIKLLDLNYKYTTLKALKKDSFKYLSKQEQEIVIELYNFSYSEEPLIYELSCMMEIYETLTK